MQSSAMSSVRLFPHCAPLYMKSMRRTIYPDRYSNRYVPLPEHGAKSIVCTS